MGEQVRRDIISHGQRLLDTGAHFSSLVVPNSMAQANEQIESLKEQLMTRSHFSAFVDMKVGE